MSEVHVLRGVAVSWSRQTRTQAQYKDCMKGQWRREGVLGEAEAASGWNPDATSQGTVRGPVPLLWGPYTENQQCDGPRGQRV